MSFLESTRRTLAWLRGADSDNETPMPPSDPTPELRDLPEVAFFLETFAAFLRQHRALWRTRRVDRFVPIDLDLADHHISIQGLIDAEMLNVFIEKKGRPLGAPDITARRGDKITLYVPAMSAPKRLLLQFSARSEVDEPLPVVSRTEGSAIAARDIVAQLSDRRADPQKVRIENEMVFPLQILVSALVFSNPHRLAERLETWADRKHRVKPNRGLDPADIEAWIRHEGDEFTTNGGSLLVEKLSDEIEKAKLGEGQEIDEQVRRDGLSYFPSLRSLLTHGIQDLLKCIVQTVDPWPPDGRDASTPVDDDGLGLNARVVAVEKFEAVADRAVEVFGAIELLEKLTDPDNQKDLTAIQELYLHLDRWTAYAVVEVELGSPFVMKFSQTLPLTPQSRLHEERWHKPKWWRRPLIYVHDKIRLSNTYHVYPLAPQDALSVHAEVVIDDPQLRMDHDTEVVTELDLATHKREIIDIVYGHELRPTGRLVHRYSSRRPESYRISDPVYLRIRLRVIRSISRGYFFASVAFLMAGTFIVWIFGKALIHHTTIGKPDAPLAVAAVAATLSLWLTATQHPRPIVYRKLWLARRAFYLALVLILGPLLLYGARQAKPNWYHPMSRGLEWFVHGCWDHRVWTAVGIVALVVALILRRRRRRRAVRAFARRQWLRLRRQRPARARG